MRLTRATRTDSAEANLARAGSEGSQRQHQRGRTQVGIKKRNRLFHRISMLSYFNWNMYIRSSLSALQTSEMAAWTGGGGGCVALSTYSMCLSFLIMRPQAWMDGWMDGRMDALFCLVAVGPSFRFLARGDSGSEGTFFRVGTVLLCRFHVFSELSGLNLLHAQPLLRPCPRFRRLDLSSRD